MSGEELIGRPGMGSPVRLVEIVGQLPYASNTTVLARDADGRPWVYKPERGEQPLWDFPWRTLAAREVGAYLVSEAMGLGVVPLTRSADGPFGPGSAQQFLDEDDEFDPRPMFTGDLDATLWPFAVLDAVINNADRKIGHLLRERGTGRLWAIDNGLSFHCDPKLRTVLWGFAGLAIPVELRDALAGLEQELAAGLCDRLAAMLSPVEAGALVQRTRLLLADGRHPPPPDDRPAVPWPIW